MSLIFTEGVGWLGSSNNADVTTHVARKWGSAGNVVKLSTAITRFAEKSLFLETTTGGGDRTNSNLRRNFESSYSTFVLGTMIEWKAGNGDSNTGSDNIHVIQFLDQAGDVQLSLSCVNGADWSELELWLGDGTTSLQVFNTGQTTGQFYLECKAYIDSTTGTFEVLINGVSVGVYSGNTQETANNNIGAFRFQTGAATGVVDDTTGLYREFYFGTVYVDDTDFVVGAHTSTIKTRKPINDGAYSDWGLSTGSDGYALVDEGPPNDDTDYLFGQAVDDRSSFGMTALSSSGSNNIKGKIHGMSANIVCRNTGSANDVRVFLHDENSVADEANQSTFNPAASYEHRQFMYLQDPFITDEFTIPAINQIQQGAHWVS